MGQIALDVNVSHKRSMVPEGLEMTRSAEVDAFIIPENLDASKLEFNVTRKEPGFPSLTTEERKALRDEFRGEIGFLSKHGSERQKELIQNAPVDGTVEEIYEFFVANGLGKLALRDVKFEVVERDGEQIPTLTGSYHIVPHPLYTSFNQHEDPNYKEYGANTGACVAVETSDGKLLVQHRSPKNKVYSDDGGASVAGLVDLPEEMTTGNFPPSGQSFDLIKVIKEHLFKEGSEEIGLSPKQISDLVATCLMIDKRSYHHEVAFFTKTQSSSSEILRNAISAAETSDGVNFKENVLVIDATPDAIFKLLTQVRNPLPTSHAYPILLLGAEKTRQLMLKRGHSPEASLRIAEGYRKKVQELMDKNYTRIDEDVRAANPESSGYNPNQPTDDQGIQPFVHELLRVFGDKFSYAACAWTDSKVESLRDSLGERFFSKN